MTAYSKARDRRGNWTAVNAGLAAHSVLSLAADPLTPGTLYAGTYGGVFKSTDGGVNWSAVNSGLTNSAIRRPGDRPADAHDHLCRRTWC